MTEQQKNEAKKLIEAVAKQRDVGQIPTEIEQRAVSLLKELLGWEKAPRVIGD